VTNRVEARCDANGHPVESRIPMSFDTDMDIASRFPVPGVCPICGSPLALKRGHYEPVDGVLKWIRPLELN
jgi:hypothetical protein